ncbi:hypothetical protein SpCBS45565_g05776 [Spizellomyces sp. 'palustris']|nr:hypothetical protein SpCBS45565_g05776 [Spizellomyces sp. 'palustris']
MTNIEAKLAPLADNPHIFQVDTKDYPVGNVTVYRDRAEVSREFPAQALKVGRNEVTILGLPELEEDTIRVEGRGPAVLVDVIYSREHASDLPAKDGTLLASLQARLQEEEVKVNRLYKKRANLTKQRQALDMYAEDIGQRGKSAKDILNSESLDGLGKFLNFYETKGEELDEKIRTLDDEINKVASVVEDVRRNILEAGGMQTKAKVQLKLVLDAEADVEMNIWLSYVILKASWSPSYDIRVSTTDQKLSLTYKAEVRQATGEDWTNVGMSLSTAMPTSSGDCPEFANPWTISTFQMPVLRPTVRSLMARTSAFGPPPPMASVPAPIVGRSGPAPGASIFGSSAAQLGSTAQAYRSDDLIAYEEQDVQTLAAPAQMVHGVTQATSGLVSASFHIQTKANIPSDNVPHTVTVALLKLAPAFEYAAVPKFSPAAYLKAKLRNTSEYALLPGPANIFVDGNFVAKSSLKNVAPEEEFECSLGVDHALRITYKPLAKSRQTAGVFSRNVTLRHTQRINVKNTKRVAATLRVLDQVPISEDEKIKVTIVKPVNGETSKDIVVAHKDKGLIEWTLTDMQPASDLDLELMYEITYPQGTTVAGV